MSEATTTLHSLEEEIRRIEDSAARATEAARKDAADARSDLSRLHERQTKIERQLSDVQAKFDGTPAREEPLRASYQSQIANLRGELQELRQQLPAAEARVTEAAATEARVARELRRDKGLFMVKAGGLLRGLNDGAVRYLAAGRLIDICAAAKIAPEAFDDLSDQRTVADTLAEFTAVRSGASTADIEEAAKLDALGVLVREVHAKEEEYAEIIRKREAQVDRLNNEQPELRQKIARLEKPETPEEIKRRQIIAWAALGGAGVAVLVIALGYILGFARGNTWMVIVLGVILLAGLVVAGMHTAQYRRWSLERARRRLAETEKELAQASADATAMVAKVGDELAGYSGRLTTLGGTSPSYQAVATVAAYSALKTAAAQQRAAWLAAHPEYAVLGTAAAPAV